MSTTTDKAKSPTPPGTNGQKPEEKVKPAGFFQLLRYASKKDLLLMFIGAVFAIANGAALPAFSLVFGDMTDALSDGSDADLMVDLARDSMLKFIYVGLGTFAASWISMGTWMYTGERQAIRFREEYFKALLRQEIGWFDTLNPSEFSSKMAGECFAIQTGLGEKVSTLLYAGAVVIAGFVVGFIKGWELTLVLCAAIPLLGITGTLFVTSIQKQTTVSTKSYATAGALAEQALSAIRTVVGLGGEEKEIVNYRTALAAAKRTVIKFGIISAFAFGAIYFANGANYTLGFWVGGYFVHEQRINPATDKAYTVGDVLTTFFAVTMGAFSISLVSPSMKAIAQGKDAGGKVLAVINRKSAINHESREGIIPEKVQGYISFQDVHFSYPTREKKVLDGLNLTIEPNQKTALVGESGCGKSTCMQLIERFYDPTSGTVTLDGTPLNQLNIKWLRQNIGYVGQEPVLFSTTVRENMKMAKAGVKDDEIIQALKQANAWDFLAKSKGLDTYVGTGGAQLSGGQKQRIAIARALLKNPPILLLDEATSALDRTNEREIQATLDELAKGRTTIVIAHRLSTVKNSDKIVLFQDGKVAEFGTHKDLIKRRGKYYEMQKDQLHPEEHKHHHHHDKHPVETEQVKVIAAATEDETNIRQSFAEERPKVGDHLEPVGGSKKKEVFTEIPLTNTKEVVMNAENEIQTKEVKVDNATANAERPESGPESGPQSGAGSEPGSPRSDPQSPGSGQGDKAAVQIDAIDPVYELTRDLEDIESKIDNINRAITDTRRHGAPEYDDLYLSMNGDEVEQVRSMGKDKRKIVRFLKEQRVKLTKIKKEKEVQLAHHEKLKWKELAKKKKQEEKQLAKDKKAVMRKLSAYTKSERPIFYLGLLAAIANGTVFPFYAVVLSNILEVVSDPFADGFMSDIAFLALMFLVLAFASLFFYGLALSMFSIIAENLTVRLRSDVYHKMLRMHIAWHDDPNNNPGALAAKLASATSVNTLTSTAIGAMLQMNSSFITGVVISFIGSWRVTLVGIALSPIMIGSGKLQAEFMGGFAAKTDAAYQGSSLFVMESLTNMRTVAALGKEREILGFFSKALQKPKKDAIKKGVVSGFLFGCSQLAMFVVFGLVFYVGSLFMRNYGEGFKDVYMAVFGIMFATMDMGNVMQLIPDAAKATATAKSLFDVLETESKIDYKNPEGHKQDTPIQGDIEFRNVSFRYPGRPDKLVLNDLSFKVNKGSKVALVGESGCGKSTVIQLLQRFYDVDSGEILLDGVNIKEYDISFLRKHFGTVSQEPVLFNGTVAENIRYIS